MSNTKHTVLDILQIVSDLRGEASVNTDAVRIRAVSRTEKDFAKRMFWRTHLLKNQTVVGSGVADYDLGSATFPFRPKGLTEVFVATTGDSNLTTDAAKRVIVDYNDFKRRYNISASERMAYEWYDVANDKWKMHINPIPAATETITYSYYWEPPTRTASSDAVICPNPRIIADLVLADLFDAEDEKQSAQLVRNEAEQLIAELVSLENAPAVNQTYTMPVREPGIGTY